MHQFVLVGMRVLTVAAVAAGLLLSLAPRAALAADIKVLSTGNMRSILDALAPRFETATGNKLGIEYGSSTAIKNRVEHEKADLTINGRAALDDLLNAGLLQAGTLIDIARSPLGIGVRAGAEKPDISRPEALKQALISAESIAVPDPAEGAQDGMYFFDLITRMGIADEIRPKIKLTQVGKNAQAGDAAAAAVDSGEAQLGVAQKRNFIALPGVVLLEPLPDIPGIKFPMTAGVITGAREREGALAFAKFLASSAVAPTIVAKGMEPYATE